MENQSTGFVYILTNKKNTVLYVGRTADLYARLRQHRHHEYPDAFPPNIKPIN